MVDITDQQTENEDSMEIDSENEEANVTEMNIEQDQSNGAQGCANVTKMNIEQEQSNGVQGCANVTEMNIEQEQSNGPPRVCRQLD